MQAAIGCAQLDKIDGFTKLRREHWEYLRENLKDLEDKLILPEPEKGASPSWFGFLISVKEDAGFTRDELVEHLEKHNIQTRNLFSGNIIKHPCFDEYREDENAYRVVGELKNTDRIMNRTFWIGVYPEMTVPKLDYMIKMIRNFVTTV